MINISSNDWFEHIHKRKTLSPTEQLYLRVGYEYGERGKRIDAEYLKSALDAYAVSKLDIPLDKLKSSRRHRNLVEARQMFAHCLKENTNISLAEIGRYYNKDHATIIFSIKKVEELLTTDKLFRIKYCNLLRAMGLTNKANKITEKYSKKWNTRNH